MMEVVSGDNWSYIRRAKLQSNYDRQQSNAQLFTDRMTFDPVAQPTVRALK